MVNLLVVKLHTADGFVDVHVSNGSIGQDQSMVLQLNAMNGKKVLTFKILVLNSIHSFMTTVTGKSFNQASACHVG